MEKAEKITEDVVEMAKARKTSQKGLPKDSSSRKPDPIKCNHCGCMIDPIYIDFNDSWTFPVCECQEKKLQQQQRRQKKEQERMKIEKLFSQSRLGKRFKRRNFDNFKVNDDNRKAYRKSRTFALHFDNKLDNGEGLIFTGGYGTGKTHLAAAILQKLIKERKITGIFVSVPDLLARIRSSWDKDSGENEKELTEALTTADLLVMDDIGAENTKPWIRERLFVIINSRYEKMLPTIFTTNCSFGELRDKIGGRITSRICEMAQGVKMEGEDYRKQLKGGE